MDIQFRPQHEARQIDVALNLPLQNLWHCRWMSADIDSRKMDGHIDRQRV